jgi:2-keto-4-pentenoate hydratase/2-oxohepta-3-ene-1,7-dioic acid hydratase in catechol pathway
MPQSMMNPVTQEAAFSLGTFSKAGCPPFAGLVLPGEQVLAISALDPLLAAMGHSPLGERSTLQLLEDWSNSHASLHAAAVALASATHPEAVRVQTLQVPMDTLTVHPPVASRQIFMSGANYFKHVVDIIVDLGPGKNPGTEGMDPVTLRRYAEDLMRRRQKEGSPYVFSKPISTLSGARDPIVLPPFAKQPDWELELAVVISAPARNVTRADAMRYVAGYTIANDLTNRDQVYVRGDMKALGTDWLTAKSCPGYLPVGPVMVPAAQVPNPHDLQLTLKLNDEVKQDERSSDMIFDIPRLIEHISHVVQLLPGYLICTGSPAGNGTHYNRYLQPGDLVESTITGLGIQRNPVVAERS